MVRTRFHPVSSLSPFFDFADDVLSVRLLPSSFSSLLLVIDSNVGFGVSEFCAFDVDVEMKAAEIGAREYNASGEGEPKGLYEFLPLVVVE